MVITCNTYVTHSNWVIESNRYSYLYVHLSYLTCIDAKPQHLNIRKYGMVLSTVLVQYP